MLTDCPKTVSLDEAQKGRQSPDDERWHHRPAPRRDAHPSAHRTDSQKHHHGADHVAGCESDGARHLPFDGSADPFSLMLSSKRRACFMASTKVAGMKAVILAGGLGTRLAEETSIRPKPMVEIGGRPLLWHLLKLYSQAGIQDFIICLGYRGYVIKEYFANYFLHMSDVTFDLRDNRMEVHQRHTEPWRVTLVDTGEHTQTGGRLKRVMPYLDHETFCMTYGDGLSDLDIEALIRFHREQGRLVTLTAVQPPGRFGALEVHDTQVCRFQEKPDGDGAWINGGFFVLEPAALGYIEGDHSLWEQAPLEHLARDQQLSAYTHRGFWHAMDTLRDKLKLEELWQSGQAPWQTWR
jgi:glucose-1-phosphate cytidylyltransferase